MIGVVLLAFVLISFFSFSQNPKVYPDFVSTSPSPTGTKAIYSYLEDNHSSVTRWSQSPDKLPSNEAKQLLIMVEPSFVEDTSKVEKYEKFMKAGNTILLFKENPKGFFGINTEPVVEYSPQLIEKPISLLNQQEEQVSAVVSSQYRLVKPKNEEIESLYQDDNGIVAFEKSYGKGSLIVAVTPDWMTNQTILDADHLDIILSLLNNQYGESNRIIFDEYVHGQTDSYLGWKVYPQYFLVTLLQVILLTILWLWYKGKRFGAIINPREEFVRYSDERLKALSIWYLKANKYRDSLLVQSQFIRIKLQDRWGISANRDWSEITDLLAKKLKRPNAEILTFYHDLNKVLEQQNISKQEYLLWSKKMDQFREEVEQA